jgi:hypothetical protein
MNEPINLSFSAMPPILHLLRCGSFGVLLLTLTSLRGQAQSPAAPFNDHQNMMDQLEVKKLRPGPNPNKQDTFSRLVDYFELHPDLMVDATKVGIEGLSRYGKAAIVTEAFEPRIAVGLIGSSGQGGTKLHRHIFGEAVEILVGGGYYWMAGNYIKYGAAEPLKTAADLPVDSHQLIALCAPRPCFISYGVVEKGDAKWVDVHGSFMAGVLTGPVYRLLGKKDFGTAGDYLTDPMPSVNQLIGSELAWRQHDGGHDVTPNWPAFFNWVGDYVSAAPAGPRPQGGFRNRADPSTK